MRLVTFHLDQKGEIQDHDYPNFRTIEKYRKYYETGKYGWYKLEWEKPAPSFGNVTKTYILHPSSWNNGTPPESDFGKRGTSSNGI